MGEDTEQIRREIEETRARMGETVEAIGYKADVPSRVRENISERIDTVKGTVSDVVSSGKEAILGRARDVSEAVGSTSERAQQGVSDALSSTGDRAQSARQAVSMVTENPLGLALGALAAGFLAGLLLPMSNAEREKIEPVRDQLVNRAQSAVSEAVDAGKSIVQETITSATSAAQESAQQHGKEIVQHATAGTPLEGQAASS
jgi:ElaB/YqjD/DUF883 family membrane-anchored ribosome-binding protein